MAHFHDSRIQTRVETIIKDKFEDIANSNHMTSSELARLLIIQFVKGDLHVSLNQKFISALKEACEISG